MHKEEHDPLNPDSEQKLYEKLLLSKEEQEILDYIRRDMRALRKYEQKYNQSTER